MNSKRSRGGFRLATSVGGTLTGRGCDILIIDDPIKSNDVTSEVALQGANDWFSNTALSRLDNPSQGLIIVTQQRLHVEDLSGALIERGWLALVIPAIATEPTDYVLAPNEFYHRPTGEVLQADRISVEALNEIKDGVGSRVFAAQYQQDPTPLEGNLVRTDWPALYSLSSHVKFQRIVVSCDPAGKAGVGNDYTALLVEVLSATMYTFSMSRVAIG